jgi:hypothetical protein
VTFHYENYKENKPINDSIKTLYEDHETFNSEINATPHDTSLLRERITKGPHCKQTDKLLVITL